MPTELGSAHGTVTIDAQLTQAANEISQFSRKSEREFDRVAASSTHAQKAMTDLAGAMGVALTIAGTVQLGRVALELGKGAAAADAAAESFDRLAARINENADEMLVSMEKASRGMVSDANLIIAANRAIASGVVHTGAELNQLLEIAAATGSTFGFTTTEAFERLVGGLSKLEPELLDELAITVKLNEVYDAYAISLGKTSEQLSEAERRQALFNEVVIETKPAVDAAAKSAGNSFEQWNQFAASFDNLKQSAGDAVNAIGFLETWTHDFQRASDELETFVGWMKQLKEWADRIKATNLGQIWADAMSGGSPPPVNPFAGGGGLAGGGGGGGSGGFGTSDLAVNPNQTKIDELWSDRFDKMADIQRQADADILDENTSYNQRRLRSEEQYQENVTRSAADFAKNRMRAQEDYEQAVSDVIAQGQARDLRMAEDHGRELARMQSDSAKRLGDMQEELDRTIAQRRADSAERLAEMAADHEQAIVDKRDESTQHLLDIEEDYERQRTQAANAHADTLIEAAGNLDARAIYNEQRRFNREQDEAAKAHDEKVQDEKDKLQEAIDNLNEAYAEKLADEQAALDKSISQANEAHERQVADENEALQTRIADANAAYAQQLSDASSADAQRLTDMAAHFTERKRREDEDQTERMTRMGEDHTAEMTQMDTEHEARLGQIATHAQLDRDALDAEHRKTLSDLGVHSGQLDKARDQYQRRVLLSQQIFQENEKLQLANAQIAMLNILKANPLLDAATLSALTTAITALSQQAVTFSTNIGLAQAELDKLPANPYDFGTGTNNPAPNQAGGASAQFMQVTGGNMPAAAMATTAGAGGTVANIAFAQGAIVVYGAPGQSVEALASIIDQRILSAVTKAAARI